tara:strand:+ start:578 stop:949 length:372 start_codon:yes stop_codon:yes gene_type:complete
MNLLDGLLGRIKKRDEDASVNNAVNAMFPTDEHVHAAIRMQNMLDQGDLGPGQYRWNQDVNPWEMSRPHFTDMMSTQEGLTPEQVAQVNSDYYLMNNLPSALNTPKNIDLLIRAAEEDKFNKY